MGTALQGQQALPLPCLGCITVSALAPRMSFGNNTESSCLISLFLLVFESNLTEFSYFIKINAEVPVVILLSVYFMPHSLIDIFALQTYSQRHILLHTVLLTIK